MVGIPFGVNVAIVLLFAFLGLNEAKRLVSKIPDIAVETALKAAGYLYVVVPMILVPMGANLLVRYKQALIWHLPLWLQYAFTALNWGIVLAVFSFVFAFASGLSFFTKHRERWKVVIVGVIIVSTVQVIQYQYTRPIAPKLGIPVVKDGVILQTSGVSCAAASGANIAGIFNINKTEKEMAELFGTSMGTSAAQVIYGMRKLGFICNTREIRDSDPERLRPPAMIFIDDATTGPESHAVAYVGLSDGKAEIWDPLMGRRLMSRNELAAIWHGRAIEFQFRDSAPASRKMRERVSGEPNHGGFSTRRPYYSAKVSAELMSTNTCAAAKGNFYVIFILEANSHN